MTDAPKKLIEVALPLAEINDASAYDMIPGIGPHRPATEPHRAGESWDAQPVAPPASLAARTSSSPMNAHRLANSGSEVRNSTPLRVLPRRGVNYQRHLPGDLIRHLSLAPTYAKPYIASGRRGGR